MATANKANRQPVLAAKVTFVVAIRIPNDGLCERLQALEIINERFARHFRMGLFNLLRRSPDITVGAIRIQPYHEFARNLPVPTNLNLIHLKPLRGTGLVVFSPSLVFIAVDNLFGGDGQLPTKVEGRELPIPNSASSTAC